MELTHISTMAFTPQQQALTLLQNSTRILLMPSCPLDGDSLGSALALYLILKKMGKEPTVVCADPVPDIYRFLPNLDAVGDKFNPGQDFIVTLDCSNADVDTIRYTLEQNKVHIIITPKKGQFQDREVAFSHGPAKYDLVIIMDAGDIQQLGPFYENNIELFYNIPTINIDHHASNAHFGRVNIVDVTAASTTEIMYRLIKAMPDSQKLMDENVATLLLAGLITDTGSFQHTNTTPRALEVAAELIDHGGRQQEIIQHVYKTKQLSTLKLWGRVLSKIKEDHKYKIVWSTVTQNDFRETDGKEEETNNIIDELISNAPGGDVYLLLKEKKTGIVSASVRTKTPSVNASDIAAQFGGGGHPQAAGFRVPIQGDVGATESLIIEKVRAYQAQRLNMHDDGETEVKAESVPSAPKEYAQQLPKKDEPVHAFLAPMSMGMQTTPDTKKPMAVEDKLYSHWKHMNSKKEDATVPSTHDEKKSTVITVEDVLKKLKEEGGGEETTSTKEKSATESEKKQWYKFGE